MEIIKKNIKIEKREIKKINETVESNEEKYQSFVKNISCNSFCRKCCFLYNNYFLYQRSKYEFSVYEHQKKIVVTCSFHIGTETLSFNHYLQLIVPFPKTRILKI